MPYTELVDIWSMGCVLYELYTGKILFPGKDNNDMLKLMQQVKGSFPSKKLKKAEFVKKHFDSELKFKLRSVDSLTKKVLTTCVRNVPGRKDLLNMLKSFTPININPREKEKIPQLADLLDKVFALDPDRRLSVDDALNHAFIKDE